MFKMVLTAQEKIFLIQNVFVNGGKYSRKVQEEFRQRFGDDRVIAIVLLC